MESADWGRAIGHGLVCLIFGYIFGAVAGKIKKSPLAEFIGAALGVVLTCLVTLTRNEIPTWIVGTVVVLFFYWRTMLAKKQSSNS